MKQSSKKNTSKTAADPKAQGNKFTASPIKASNLTEIAGALKLDRNLESILSQIGGYISIDIAPGGVGVVVKSLSDHRRICDIQEIRKIGTFMRFVAEDEKVQSSKEVLEPVLTAFYTLRLNAGRPVDVPLNPNQVVTGKEFCKRLDVLEKNREFITNSQEMDGLKGYLVSTISKCYLVIGQALLLVEAGTFDKGVITDILLRNTVPGWLYQKLTTSVISSQGAFDSRKYLFPADGLKGIEVSVLELQTDAFIGHNIPIFRGSNHLIKAYRNVDFIQNYFHAAYDHANRDTTDTRLLLEQKVLLLPPWIDGPSFVDAKASGKLMKQESIIGDTIANRVRTMSHATMTTYQLEVSKFLNPLDSIWSVLYPANRAQINVPENRGQSPFGIIKTIPNYEVVLRQYTQRENDAMRRLFFRFLQRQLGDIRDENAFFAYFNPHPFAPLPAYLDDNVAAVHDAGNEVLSRLRGRLLNEVGRATSEDVKARIKPPAKKGTARTAAPSLTIPSRMMKKLSELQESGKIPGATVKSLISWLRSFNAEAIQAVAFHRMMGSLEDKGLLALESDEETESEKETED